MRKDNASFVTKFISEAGSYLVNSDYFAFVELKDYACYVIADGIDIDEKKESAKLAITTVITRFSENPGMSAGKLKQYMKAAHQALLEEAEEIRLEVSMAILLTDYKKAMWAHAGNCRLYWMKNGSIRVATKDTSLTQKMVDEEEIPIDQLAYHEERNNLYTYLGQPGRFSPVISGKKVLEDGDILILMTRGVWENVGEAELIDAIDGVSKAEDVCTGLEDVILSQRLDVIENYTIATVFVDKIYKNPNAGKYKKWIKIGVSVTVVLLTLLITLTITHIQKNKSNIEKMEKYKGRGIEYLQEYNYASADEQMEQAYSASENVKAGKRSQNYAKVMCVETYEKLTDNLNRGMQALQEKEYKKAVGLFQMGVGLRDKLSEEYGEDITLFKMGINSYLSYSQYMYDGIESLGINDYQKASDLFSSAANLMDEIDDITNRNVAVGMANEVNAKILIADAITYEAMGDDYRSEEKNHEALSAFETAEGLYEIASEKYGAMEATNKIPGIQKKRDEAKNAINNMTDVQKEEKAREYEKEAYKAESDGNYEMAVECYEEARKLYVGTMNTAKVTSLDEKIENALKGSDREEAAALLRAAMGSVVAGDRNGAISYLNAAKKIYDKLEDTDASKEIQSIINSLNSLSAQQKEEG